VQPNGIFISYNIQSVYDDYTKEYEIKQRDRVERWVSYSHMKGNLDRSFFRVVTMYVFDRQRDGRTDSHR